MAKIYAALILKGDSVEDAGQAERSSQSYFGW